MSTPMSSEENAPVSPAGEPTEPTGVGCLAITLMALLCVGAMLALVALIGDPT